MSYDITLLRDGDPVTVERHTEGGIHILGGTDRADLNVTYNYYRHFDFRGLDGRTGADTLFELKAGVALLGVERDPDYWNPTEGNVVYTLEILRRWAEQYPDATWEVV